MDNQVIIYLMSINLKLLILKNLIIINQNNFLIIEELNPNPQLTNKVYN